MSIESEQSLLGALLRDNGAYDRIPGFPGSAFVREDHRTIFRAIQRRLDAGKPADIILLAEVLEAHGELNRVGGLAYLGELVQSVNTSANIRHYAKSIEDAAILRKLRTAAEEISLACDSKLDPREMASEAETKILSVLDTETERDYVHIKDAVAEAVEWEEEDHTGLSSGLRDLDELTNGFGNGHLVIVAGRPGMGKAQPLDSKVLMASGEWKQMGDLKFGDAIASVDGAQSRVLAIHDRGEREVFKITMSDGRFTEACADHLWTVEYREWAAPRTINTVELARMLSCARYKNRLSIQMVSGDFGENHVPLDPYVLGVLLGDGSFCGSGVRLTSADVEIVSEVQSRLGVATEVRRVAGSYAYSLSSRGVTGRQTEEVKRNGRRWYERTIYPVRKALDDLGLSGLKGEDKFIPSVYLSADREARLDLLRGLLDTDGWAEVHGSIRFTSSSMSLAEGVRDLVRSLGGTCDIAVKTTTYKLKGEIKSGRAAFICRIRHQNGQELFNLKRKKDRAVRGRNSSVRLNFKSVELSRVTETRCITVTHPSCLYVTDDYIVTHNSALAGQIAENVSKDHPAAFFTLEMTRREVAGRMLKYHTAAIGRGEAVRHLFGLNMQIDDTPAITVGHIRSRCRRIKRQHGLSLIVVDYLQLMRGNGDNRNQEIGGISRGLKSIAKEFDVPVIALSQLSRKVEERADKRPLMSDLRESGEIEQDADLILFVYRDDDNEETRGTAEIICRKNRHGGVGDVRVTFQGEYTRFSNYDGPTIDRGVRSVSKSFRIGGE